MKKITLLLTLLLCVAGTAWAQQEATEEATAPAVDQVLTASQLQALTSETHVAIKSVEKNNYGSKWYAGISADKGLRGYGAFSIFIWEPITEQGAATGAGYLRKAYPAAADGAGYIQTTGFANLGAKSSAQVFYPIKPTSDNNSNPNDNWGPGAEITTHGDYNAANLVRLLAGDNANATSWANFNGLTCSSTLTGVWTAMEIRRATPCVHTPVTNLANLSNSKAYTLVNQRTSFMMNANNTRLSTRKDQSNADYDAANTKQQFALLKNSVGAYFLYSISARKFISNDGWVSDSPTQVTLANGNVPGSTFFLQYDSQHRVNTSNEGGLVIDGWGYADDGNSNVIYEVDDVSIDQAVLDKIQVRTVTANFNITVGDVQKTYKTANFNILVNNTITRADLEACIADAPYVSVVSWDKTDAVTENNTTVNVTCNENLPFTKSESVENATWYLIDMHSNDNGAGDILNGSKNYLWTATTDPSAYTTAEVTLPKYDTKQSSAFGDNMLWCFVGNAADGFKIYNKAAGSGYALSKPATGNTAVKLAAVADATAFRIYTSTAINGAVCFKKEGDDHYINTQSNPGTGNVKALRGWTSPDGGSSCRLFAPDRYLLNYAADVPAGPAHSLGTAQYFNAEGKYDSFKTAVAHANSNHHNLTYTTALATVLTEYAAADKTTNSTTITNNGYYRLMNCAYGRYLTSGTNNNDENVLWGGEIESTARSFAGTIVKVVENGDNYKLYVQGLEVGTVVKDTHVKLTAAGGTFTITNTNNKYVFADVSTPEPADPTYRCLHHASGNRIVGWEASAEASKWYVIPATELEVSLHTVDNKTYATTYLPFDATLPANVKAYIVTQAQNGLATMSEVTDIRANEGIVLVGQTDKATLTIGTATSDFNNNLLQGTNVPTTIQNADDYYILGFSENGNGVGFYHPNSTTLKANRAYLPKSNVAPLNSSFSLDFENVSTGIEAAATNAEQGAACYDLSGRRVNRPAKGLYVKNGKKIIVK